MGQKLTAKDVWNMCKNDDIKHVRKALTNDPSLVNEKYGDESLLHLAAWNDKTEMVKLLASLGANVNDKGPDGHTPLVWGIGGFAGLETVKALIQAGADLNYHSPLQRAYAKNDDILCELLKAGSREVVNDIFLLSVMGGDERVVDLLLDLKQDVNTKDNRDGATLLMWAACLFGGEANLRIAEKLLAHGAKLDIQDNDGYTALHKAVRSSVPMATLYLNHGAKMDAKNDGGETPLMAAARLGTLDMMQLLLNRASTHDLAQLGAHGEDLLCYAAFNPNNGVCKLVLDKGFYANAADTLGWTALHEACYAARFDNIQVLLDAGANPLAKNNRGKTPLDLMDDVRKYDKNDVYYKCLNRMKSIAANTNPRGVSSIFQDHTKIDSVKKVDAVVKSGFTPR